MDVFGDLLSDLFNVFKIWFKFYPPVLELFIPDFLLHISVIILLVVLFELELELFMLNFIQPLLFQAFDFLKTDLAFKHGHFLI